MLYEYLKQCGIDERNERSEIDGENGKSVEFRNVGKDRKSVQSNQAHLLNQQPKSDPRLKLRTEPTIYCF